MKIKKITLEENAGNCQKIHTLDSKRLTDVLVHKRLRGQIYILLLSEHRSTVCCPNFFVVYHRSQVENSKREIIYFY